MKTLIASLIAIALIFSGCKDDEDVDPSDPNTKGCLTGLTDQGTRVLIRCCTRNEYAAGSNASAGGTASWNLYTKHEWKAVKDCNECK